MENESQILLKRDGNIALYSQLVDIISDQIETGIIKPGQAILSERELGKKYGMSRMTVRRAIDRLVTLGQLTRVSGKGTFVSEPKFNFAALSLAGLRDQALKMGMEPGSHIIDIEKVVASGSISENLKIQLDELVFKIERVFFTDDIPISIQRSYIPCDYIPNLMNINLKNESLYGILRTNHGIELHHASEKLESTLASSRESLILGIPVGSPMILLRIILVDDKDRPIEYVKVVFRGDKVQLNLMI
jgi:GntR family transcriptional regulator